MKDGEDAGFGCCEEEVLCGDETRDGEDGVDFGFGIGGGERESERGVQEAACVARLFDLPGGDDGAGYAVAGGDVGEGVDGCFFGEVECLWLWLWLCFEEGSSRRADG